MPPPYAPYPASHADLPIYRHFHLRRAEPSSSAEIVDFFDIAATLRSFAFMPSPLYLHLSRFPAATMPATPFIYIYAISSDAASRHIAFSRR